MERALDLGEMDLLTSTDPGVQQIDFSGAQHSHHRSG